MPRAQTRTRCLVRVGDYVWVDPNEPAAHGRLIADRDLGRGGETVVRCIVPKVPLWRSRPDYADAVDGMRHTHVSIQPIGARSELLFYITSSAMLAAMRSADPSAGVPGAAKAAPSHCRGGRRPAYGQHHLHIGRGRHLRDASPPRRNAQGPAYDIERAIPLGRHMDGL